MQTLSRSLMAAAAAALMLPALAHADAVKLKIGTAASVDSPWGHAFKVWKKAIESKTSDAVSLELFFGSTKGSETAMVDKMKAGELDGAAVTALGLAKYDRRLLVMELPGVIRSWKAIDAVRGAMGPTFEKWLNDKNVTLVNWGDIGLVHTLSKGYSVRVPDDLKGKSPWVYADDPVVKMLYAKIGGVTAFPADLMLVGPSLDNGKIDCINAPMIGAEMLQWASKVDHGVDSVGGVAVGALILATDALDKLPGDGKKVVVETGQVMSTSSAGLKAKLRTEDAAAWERFKARSGVTIYTPTDDDIAKWKPVFQATIDGLKAGTFDPALVDKVVSIALANQ